MQYKRIYIIGVLFIISFTLRAQVQPQAGIWRGVFTLAGGHAAPFNFELAGKTAYLLNGAERFDLKNVTQRGDSIFMPVDVYNTVLAAKIVDAQTLSGAFKSLDPQAQAAGVPFRAEFGKRYRFVEQPATPTVSMHGKWDISIDETVKLIGVFDQRGSKLTGTFLSTGGDLRYYEGSVQGDEFSLSAFDGSSPQLFTGKIKGNELTGSFVNRRQVRLLKGTRNAKAALPDAYGITTMKAGVPFTFTFPDAFTGKPVSLSDPKYKGKVVIVTTLGSWCHNCMDEAAFLSPWYKANKQRGIEIIGLAFEAKNDPAFAKARLETVKNRYQIDYDILFAGIADTKHASEVLPALSEMSVYPTTIYVKRNGEVAKVHTGYSGPATGQYYEEFVKEFKAEMDQLLNESASAETSKGTNK